jgi:hypothetical protein
MSASTLSKQPSKQSSWNQKQSYQSSIGGLKRLDHGSNTTELRACHSLAPHILVAHSTDQFLLFHCCNTVLVSRFLLYLKQCFW